MIAVSIELPSRVVATVLAPLSSTFDHRAGTVQVRAALFLDAAAYEAGAQPVEPPRLYSFTAEEVAAVLAGSSMDLTAPVVGLLMGHVRFAPPAPEAEAGAEAE
jgi:hypothetical protein